MKRFKNNKGSADTWVGQMINPDNYYTIDASEIQRWQNDSKVLADIGSGDGIMNDGDADIEDVAAAINFLKDVIQTPTDSDGSPIFRNKVTQTGWSFQMHGFEFETSKLDSVYSKKQDGTDFGFATIKLYDSIGVEITSQLTADLSCVETRVDWEPTHDYEIIGGLMKQLGLPATDVRMWVVGAPDVPAAYGGSKLFCANINLKFLAAEEGVNVDGRASKYLTYDATYHKNKIRLILKHEPGVNHRIHMIMELFKA